MNPIIFDDVANSIFKLRMYPYFDIANYILMSISVKEDTPQSGMYLINYFPFDLLYRLCKILPVRLLVCSLKEVQRAKKIFIGVHHGLHLFPNSPVMCVLLGLLKGEYCKLNDTSLYPNWYFTTKISLLAAIAYYCHHLDIIPLPENQLFLVIMTLFVYLRITMILLGLKDPFVPFENAVCKLLFGGTVDAIRSAFERSRSKASEAMPSNLSNVSGTTSSSTANMTGNANFSSPSTGTGQSSQGLPNSNANSFNSSGLRDATNRQTPSSGDKKRD
ncbi:unnamed protein product [Schistosoma margrebowiei]|uniref:Uncharacterized protein n=1 Tax=Schistosoma margrebowiei TaxID=48269 RepID=A0A183MM18_9TREM|nr:unnamed protein product [Schistosoma margrebowiei]